MAAKVSKAAAGGMGNATARSLGLLIGALMAKHGNGDKIYPALKSAAEALKDDGVHVTDPKRSTEFYAARDAEKKGQA